MRIFTNLTEQFKQFWDQTTVRARVGIVATAVLCLVTIAGVGVWSARPQYVPFARDLDPAEAPEIKRMLEAEGIPTKYDFWASTLLVPRSQLSDARMAAGNLVGPTWRPLQGLEESITASPEIVRENLRLHQEARLAASIAHIASVANATVHISRPKYSPFVKNERPTTASVMLELRKGFPFTSELGSAIVALVANGVEGLDPERVTVLDTVSERPFIDSNGPDTILRRRYEYKLKIESDLASKAQWMLAEMLGSGRASVRVTADIDFDETVRKIETYDPDTKAKNKETVFSKTTSGTKPSESGLAGTASNVGTGASGKQRLPSTDKEEKIETTYDNSVTRDTVTEAAGTIKLLTVAAAVDLHADGDADAASASGVTKEQVEAILKQAVGFSETRNDQIEVVVTKLAGVDPLVPVAAPGYPRWESINQLLRNVSLGLASVVALILGLLIVRRMRPVGDPAAASHVGGVERARQIAELSERALANPEALSKIIHVWLNEAQQDEGEGQGADHAERDSEHEAGNDVSPSGTKRDAMAA